MSDPVAAIVEAAATGETAAIFADIRQVLGVDVVNLVWRHLATIEGALPWAWPTLRPLYVDGSMVAEASALQAQLALPFVPPVPAEALTGLNLQEDELTAINDVLNAYNRTNAMALIALSTLRASLTNPAPYGGAATGQPLPTLPPPQRIRLPYLPSLSELPPPTAALVVTLNRLGTRRPDAMLASMYRHLAHWPSFLALAWSLLAPLDADGRLEAAIIEARRLAELRAGQSISRVVNAQVAAPPTLASLVATLEPFVGDVIAKMVVICALLRGATPDSPRVKPERASAL